MVAEVNGGREPGSKGQVVAESLVAEVNVGRKVAGRRGSRGQWWQSGSRAEVVVER